MSDTPFFDEQNEAHGTFPEELPVEPETPSKVPQPKVIAATTGAGVGVALGTVITWIVEASAGIDIPDGVELAIGVIFTAGLAFVGGYWKKN